MMTFIVRLFSKVDKFLKKQDKHTENHLRERLRFLESENPYRYLEHYEGADCYKFRLGEYRALIDIDNTRKIIFVRILDHRSKIYKR